MTRAHKRGLSIKIAPKTDALLQELVKTSDLNKSRLIRVIISEIEDDLISLKNPKGLKRLQEIAMIIAA